jgi:cobyrinic acid a,c-diamide synthase
MDCPRIAFSALRGNSGKTLLTVGVVACLHKKGKAVSPFKKGPDYIDAAWLGLAADRPCYNLDAFLMEREALISSFTTHVRQSDVAIVEGNRGLFDGMDAHGSYSTAELAKMLQIPVVIIVDCSMATRTVAAMVLGCQHLDPEVAIKGVILNRVRGNRHESIVRRAVEENCGVPVLGSIPRIKGSVFPERHMGLVPPQEHPGARKAVDKAVGIVEEFVDIEEVWKIALDAPPLDLIDSTEAGSQEGMQLMPRKRPRIGFIRDSAFWFYYPDNLEALERLGAEMVECNALLQDELPRLDALYIGGGFPETHAEALAANSGFRRSLNKAVEDGLPVYAECGGLMYLGRNLLIDGSTFPMTGVFPLTIELKRSPQGHGYTILEVDKPNPYFKVGEVICGHEFHYSRIVDLAEKEMPLAFKVRRGCGVDGRRDGLYYRNVLATYSHLHVLGTKEWAEGLFDQAISYGQKPGRKREDVPFNEGNLPAALNF